jgi:hypothetical protein
LNNSLYFLKLAFHFLDYLQGDPEKKRRDGYTKEPRQPTSLLYLLIFIVISL